MCVALACRSIFRRLTPQHKTSNPSTPSSPDRSVSASLERRNAELTVAHLENPTIQQWAETLLAERKALWASRGREKEEREGLEGVYPGSKLATPNGA